MFRIPKTPLLLAPSLALSLALAASALAAQNSTAVSDIAPRVVSPIDESNRVILHGNVHPLAQARFDKGAVDDAFPASRLLLLLKRSDAQEQALQDYIQAEHIPGNPSFHRWLKPNKFGELFGPADSDVAAVKAWLESHGFIVNQAHPGKGAIEFSGTAGQLRQAFHTEIHRYVIDSETHLANAQDPEVPAALAPVILGLAPMNDFNPVPALKVLGRAEFNPKTHQTTHQEWTYPDGGGYENWVVAPGDFAVEYNINPVYQNGVTGTGQTIGIVSASNVDLNMVAAYRKLFGLSANLPDVVVDGEDPGQNGAAIEAYLDVEETGSVAPGARVLLYTSNGTALAGGLALAAYRAVDDDLAAVLSTSYLECEAALGAGGNAFWYALWEQAAAQGQTSFVAAGDGGSASCDNFDTQAFASGGLAVNGLASTPFNVAVGGTDFYYSDYAASTKTLDAQLAEYWSLTTTTSPAVSLIKHLPEQVWNNYLGYNLSDAGDPANYSSSNIVAGSGGRSSAAVYNQKGMGSGYRKPSWQTGRGIPEDRVRDLPDVSLYAADGYNFSFYPICARPGDCTTIKPLADGGAPWITGVGGTSASSPAMAGIQALVNQSTGGRQGQADFFYYPIADNKTWSDAFYDVTVGGNEVVCNAGSANCVTGKKGTPAAGLTVESGYAATPGYDLASGLGTVNVANLVKWWPAVKMTATTTTLSVKPAAFVHGAVAGIESSVSPSSGSGTPTGNIALVSNDGESHSAGLAALPLTSGSASFDVNYLPGGTYQLTARYGGNGKFAPSASAPVTLVVSPETLTISASGWAYDPASLSLNPLTPGIELPYGTPIILDAQPVSRRSTSSNPSQPATGAVTFTDRLDSKITTASTHSLDDGGVAEWSSGVFAVGSHTVNESFSGDPSYKPVTLANAASFKVFRGSTNIQGGPLATSVSAGGTVTVDVQLSTGKLPLYGKIPTGVAKVTLGPLTKTAPWAPFGTKGDSSLEAMVTFTNVPHGLLPVVASYAGDANWMGTTMALGTVTSTTHQLIPAVTLKISSADPGLSQPFTLTATVVGPKGKPAPTGTVLFIGDDNAIYSGASLSRTGTAIVTFEGEFVQNGTNIVSAIYQGNANYSAGSSSPLTFTVSKADFSLITLAPQVAIAAGRSGSSTIVISPIDSTGAEIALNATVPSGSGITAKPASLVLKVNGATKDEIAISVPAHTSPGTYPIVVTGTGVRSKLVHNALILVTVPKP